MRSIRASLSAGGEPLKFGIDSTQPSRERLVELLQSCGLSLVEQRTLGAEQETEGKRAWGGFATLLTELASSGDFCRRLRAHRWAAANCLLLLLILLRVCKRHGCGGLARHPWRERHHVRR